MLKENSVKISASHNPAPFFFSIIFGFLFFFSSSLCLADTLTQANDKKTIDGKVADKKLYVTSDKMVAQKDSSMVEFMGNVKAIREDSIILADSIKIFIHTPETKKEGQTDLKKIIASGNVEYTAGKRKAFADKAVYTTKDEILILTGKEAKLITGKSHVTGSKITLYRNEDKAIVESEGTTRVQAIFNPEDQKKGNTQ
jgi:lipopolysaccharide export system protein LptA